jgi:hypothetical protein
MQSYPALLLLLLPACAQLHHAQIGDIDDRPAAHVKPIDIKISETGLSLHEAETIARTAPLRSAGAVGDVLAIVQLFQMGTRTGHPVMDAAYAENILELMKAECPDGELANLQLVREMRRYPVISGEIVKVTGECRTLSKRSQS